MTKKSELKIKNRLQKLIDANKTKEMYYIKDMKNEWVYSDSILDKVSEEII